MMIIIDDINDNDIKQWKLLMINENEILIK